MLRSLFGDLRVSATAGSEASGLFTPVNLVESSQPVADPGGRLHERRQQELLVKGSPAIAMREHLAQAERGDQIRVITLLDPSRMWAPSVIRALSDATGQATERLHIRNGRTSRPSSRWSAR